MYDYDGLDDIINEEYHEYITEDDIYDFIDVKMTDKDKCELIKYIIGTFHIFLVCLSPRITNLIYKFI